MSIKVLTKIVVHTCVYMLHRKHIFARTFIEIMHPPAPNPVHDLKINQILTSTFKLTINKRSEVVPKSPHFPRMSSL